MTKLIPGFFGFIIICLLLAVLVQQESLTKMKEEIGVFRRQEGQIAQLTIENRGLSNLIVQANGIQIPSNHWFHELPRLRSEVGVLRKNQREQLAISQSLSAGNSIAEPGAQMNHDRQTFAFAGYSTPESAFGSALWAGTTGDKSNFLASLSPEDREKKAKEWEGKSENDISALQSNYFAGLNGYRILGKEPISNDEVLLDVSVETDFTRKKFKLINVGGEWKVAGLDN